MMGVSAHDDLLRRDLRRGVARRPTLEQNERYGKKGDDMRSHRAVMAVFALAAILLIPAGIALAAPAPASHAEQTAARPAAGQASSHVLYRKDAVPLAAAGSTRHGCPYYYACMYTTSGWKNNTPEHEWYYYGCYALSNEYGTRYIYDNQSGGGDIAGFGNYTCNSGTQWAAGPGGWLVVNITPTNSVEIYH
jgi:hypothetical protein